MELLHNIAFGAAIVFLVAFIIAGMVGSRRREIPKWLFATGLLALAVFFAIIAVELCIWITEISIEKQ